MLLEQRNLAPEIPNHRIKVKSFFEGREYIRDYVPEELLLLVFCKRAFRKYAPEVLLFLGKELLELGILQGDVLVKSIELKVSFCS